MRISDWSSDVFSSDLALFARRTHLSACPARVIKQYPQWNARQARRQESSTECSRRDGAPNLLEWLADVLGSIGEGHLINRIDDLRPCDLVAIAGVNDRYSWVVIGLR